MLIIEIALGIVLGVLILRHLDKIVAAAGVILIIGIALLVVGAIGFGIFWFLHLKGVTVEGAELLTLLVLICIPIALFVNWYFDKEDAKDRLKAATLRDHDDLNRDAG